MAYGILSSVRAAGGGSLEFATAPEYYDGLLSKPKLRIYLGGSESFNYIGPWNAQQTDHLYLNRNLAKGSYEYNMGRNVIILNADGSFKSITITFRSGAKIVYQNASPQCVVYGTGGEEIARGSLGGNPSTFTHFPYILIDYDSGQALLGNYYLTPVFDSTSSIYGGWTALSGFSSQTARETFYQVLMLDLPIPDPYQGAGYSETANHPEGSFDDVSDTVQMPGVPSLNLSVNGFVTAYAPTLAQINALATFVWSDWLSGGPTLPKIFANPEDAIISLHMLPFEPSTSTAVEVTVGNYASGVYMDPMSQQFYTVNCGSLEIEEYWGNYLDYNPYTKLTLFLPYVGEITLNPDEVMTHVITIKYRIDGMTGAFVAFILRDDDKILGEYQGNCSLQVPISSANYAQLHSALLGLAGSAVSLAVGAAGSGISGLLSGGTNVLTSAAGMMDSKIRHSHSGALGSASGFMGSQAPYLIIERARQCVPLNLNHFAGYPSQITAKLGDLIGYTSVSEIVLDGIPLTDEELAELREILKGGVYL